MTKRRQLIQKKNRHPSKNHTLLVFVISRVKQYNNYSDILVWKSGALDIENKEKWKLVLLHACKHAYLLHVKDSVKKTRCTSKRSKKSWLYVLCLKCRFFHEKFKKKK